MGYKPEYCIELHEKIINAARARASMEVINYMDRNWHVANTSPRSEVTLEDLAESDDACITNVR